MTPESQRIAIAEACGWNGWGVERLYNAVFVLTHPTERCSLQASEKHCWTIVHDKQPDYLNDLNAMNESEKVLNEKQLDVMRDFLSDIFKRDYPERDTIRVWRCTSPQRAEAFLRTLNLWTDDGKE